MIAIALLRNDKLYYRENNSNERVRIGSAESCNMVIPELK